MSINNDRASWMGGPGAMCSVEPAHPAKPYRLILLGAPGVGKGTQSELLSAKLHACHLSTGDIFRSLKNLKESERSPVLNEAVRLMESGALVPDKTVIDIVRTRMRCMHCPGGMLFDGFPRTVPQAEALTKMLEQEHIVLNAVVNYEMPIDVLLSRVSGRRTCATCKSVYHVMYRAPKREGICDRCGGVLFQREDDRLEAVRVRMEAYLKSTAPVAGYYQERGMLISIDSDGEPEEVLRRTLDALGYTE